MQPTHISQPLPTFNHWSLVEHPNNEQIMLIVLIITLLHNLFHLITD
jgi:hypothetical protein